MTVEKLAAVDPGGRIVEVRGERVLIDSDLGSVDGVSTKVFNRAIQRNGSRFPADFAFRLTKAEFDDSRSQIVTSSPG